jgi:hypothetical protein
MKKKLLLQERRTMAAKRSNVPYSKVVELGVAVE